MTIEISAEARAQAIASIERYFAQENGEPIGNMAAGALLNFFLADIGPVIYNTAIVQAQESMQSRVADLHIDLHETAFTWWHKRANKR